MFLLLLVACGTDVSVSPGKTDNDGDGYSAEVDCDDAHATVNPDAAEVCDEQDNNCDGEVDEGVTTPFYADTDGDTFGDADDATAACAAPAGYVADATDCDDTRAEVNPAAVEVCDGLDNNCDEVADNNATDAATFYADGDADTYGDAASPMTACDLPAGYVADATDCDDTLDAVNPAAVEVCDALDNNCDGTADNDATDAVTFYADGDADTFGDAEAPLAACTAPSGYVADATDCDDTRSTVNPAAPEVCDTLDNNCDGDVDEGATDAAPFYADTDGDTFGDATATVTACTAPSGYVADATDCDDARSAVNPAAAEVCDGLDDDCDGAVDEGATDASRWYPDADRDGYGDDTSPVDACEAPAGALATGGDCADHDAAVHPGAEEVCDGLDQDCDGTADDGATDAPLWYADADGDGAGGDTAIAQCDAPPGYTASPTDCDDGNAAVHPGATEACDAANVDEDCDGLADDRDTAATGKTRWYRDADADTFGASTGSTTACDLPSGYVATATDCDDGDATVNPAAVEVCDAADTDEDCDGLADDADPSVTGTTAWFTDADGDGYAGPTSVTACTAPAGSSSTTSDCDDADGTISPAGVEVCDDSIDQDCDGLDEVCGGLRGDFDVDVGYATKIYGTASTDYFAIELISGDFNGDGAGDLVVAAPNNSIGGEKGTVYAYYGPFDAGASLATAHDDLLLYSTSHHPEASMGTQFGNTMGNIGDVNGDGRDDFWTYRLYEPGMVFYGGDTGVAADTSKADGNVTCTEAGAAGDVYPTTTTPEWVCGDAGYGSGSGRAFVYTGASTQVAEITAEDAGDFAGAGYAGGGDVDGDGVDDLWIGAPLNTGYQGAAYLLLGPVSGTVPLASADAKLVGTGTYDGLGWDFRNPGDVDGDGYGDTFVGAPRESSLATFAGAIYLVTDPRSGDVTDIAAATVLGTGDSDTVGADNFSLGDVNGDGDVDLLTGSAFCDVGATDGGCAWLVYGPMAGTTSLVDADARWVSSEASAYLSLYNVEVVPDTNGDGADEVALGARAANTGGYTDNGAVWVWLGEP